MSPRPGLGELEKRNTVGAAGNRTEKLSARSLVTDYSIPSQETRRDVWDYRSVVPFTDHWIPVPVIIFSYIPTGKHRLLYQMVCQDVARVQWWDYCKHGNELSVSAKFWYFSTIVVNKKNLILSIQLVSKRLCFIETSVMTKVFTS
jgi:hypothetical protein